MIIVTLNEDRYAYDIHSLVKAFYPEQEIKVFVKGTKEERSDAGLPAFFVEFDETSICAGIEDGGTKTVNLKTPEDRGTVKNDLKQLLYALLSEETGKTLPWGTLTGIRPTKIAKQLLEQGQTEQEVAAYMEHTYLASKEKTELSIDIAKREMQILSGIHYEEGYSLYIGIPFCPTTCLYCSNPQTMKQETLDLIGRRHTVAQTVEAFRLAREEGFDNINMDLILGLPGETKEDVEETIHRVQELGPDSLTVHSLAIKRASRLSQWILEHGISTLHNTDETMAIAAQGAKQMGMEPYYLYRQKNMSGNFENVGYAKPGKAGIYNILIMEEVQSIMALGAGTISKRVYGDGRIERCDNVKDVGQYIERIDEMIQRKQRLFSEE